MGVMVSNLNTTFGFNIRHLSVFDDYSTIIVIIIGGGGETLFLL